MSSAYRAIDDAHDRRTARSRVSRSSARIGPIAIILSRTDFVITKLRCGHPGNDRFLGVLAIVVGACGDNGSGVPADAAVDAQDASPVAAPLFMGCPNRTAPVGMSQTRPGPG